MMAWEVVVQLASSLRASGACCLFFIHIWGQPKRSRSPSTREAHFTFHAAPSSDTDTMCIIYQPFLLVFPPCSCTPPAGLAMPSVRRIDLRQPSGAVLWLVANRPGC